MLNDTGNRFASYYYYRFDRREYGEYVYHYLEAFDCTPSIYDVEDSWENYNLIRDAIQAEYHYWIEQTQKNAPK